MDQVLVLFDIDGTLISNSRAGTEAYIAAIEMCYDIKVEIGDYVPDGKTDLLIMSELLARYNIDMKDTDIEKLVGSYLSVLPEKLLLDPGSVLPGVQDLLDELSDNDAIILGLATGNLENGAKKKLDIHRLYKYFSVGGFGSDAADRHSVVEAGIHKAKSLAKGNIRRSVVIGDTPMDIKAAKSNGVEVLAVATGKFPMEKLKDAGADLVVSDLKNYKEEIIRFLLA